MRVAFVGKGGVGKSSLAGTFARILGSSGERVVALDSDPMPGMAYSLGVAQKDAGLPDEAVEEYDEGGSRRFRQGVKGAEQLKPGIEHALSEGQVPIGRVHRLI